MLLSNARLAVERKELGSAAELLATLRRLRPAVARLGPAEGPRPVPCRARRPQRAVLRATRHARTALPGSMMRNVGHKVLSPSALRWLRTKRLPAPEPRPRPVPCVAGE